MWWENTPHETHRPIYMAPTLGDFMFLLLPLTFHASIALVAIEINGSDPARSKIRSLVADHERDTVLVRRNIYLPTFLKHR